MPKTSKKSKASKSTGLKKKFDLSSKKVQFFVVIAIVALLGGGWFTYKSFAATATTWPMSPRSNLFSNRADHPCTSSKNTDPSKGGSSKQGAEVVTLGCPATGSSAGPQSSAIGGIRNINTGGGAFQVCSMLKGRGLVSISYVANGQRISSTHNVNTSDYTKFCTENKSLTNGISSFAAEVKISYNGTPQVVNVADITLTKTGIIGGGVNNAGGTIK